MAEPQTGEPTQGTAFTVFDYLGLGFILVPPAVTGEAAMNSLPLRWPMAIYGIPLIVIGSIFIWIGRHWLSLRHKWAAAFVHIIETLSRSYIILFMLFVLFISGLTTLPLLVWPPSSRDTSATLSVSPPASTAQAQPKTTPNAGIGYPLAIDWDAAMIVAHQRGNTARPVPGSGTIVIEPGNGALQIDSFIIYAHNAGNINIAMERAYIVSDVDQRSIPMEVGSPPSNFFHIAEINPVMPGTTMLFKANFGGVNAADFAKAWPSFSAVIKYNGRTIRNSYDDKWISDQIDRYRTGHAQIITAK